jgi:hypothetical protein
MMGQALYLLGSLAGVAAMVGLCVLLFGRGIATLDAATAEARLKDDVPGFRAGSFALSEDGRAALVEDLRSRAIYFIAVRGDSYVTRQIARGYLKQSVRNGAALNLRFTDFTFPKAAMSFADENAAREWETRIAAA